MKNNKKLTEFIAHTLKLADMRVKEEQRIKKLQKKAKIAKRNYGCGGSLPTDTNWEAVMADHSTNRFYNDVHSKGSISRITYALSKC